MIEEIGILKNNRPSVRCSNASAGVLIETLRSQATIMVLWPLASRTLLRYMCIGPSFPFWFQLLLQALIWFFFIVRGAATHPQVICHKSILIVLFGDLFYRAGVISITW